MRVLPIITFATLLAAPLANAADDCQFLTAEDLSAEDVSIMVSVRPQPVVANPTRYAQKSPVHVLYSVPDYFGRMSEEDLSQIHSVQPQGEKIVLCPRPDTRKN
jgi:hypothetical protein